MFKHFLQLIKFSHTLFALPFALVGYFLGVQHYGFDYVVLLQVLGCMVLARTAAMAFNRLVDREWDAKNPRTKDRELPAGKLSTEMVKIAVLLCAIGFCLLALSINFLCFVLSPVALLVMLGYSYTKRFTALSHLVLGVALGIAPLGAYIAVAGGVTIVPILFVPLVVCWVAGFDIIFSLQDEEFDRAHGLHSIPVWLGTKGARWVSRVLHLLCAGVVVAIGFYIEAEEILYWMGASLFIGLLIAEHIMASVGGSRAIRIAFAVLNSWASVVYATFTIVSLFW